MHSTFLSQTAFLVTTDNCDWRHTLETNPKCIWKTARCRVCHPVTHPERMSQSIPTNLYQGMPLDSDSAQMSVNWGNWRVLHVDHSAHGPSKQFCGTCGEQTMFKAVKNLGHKSEKFRNPFAPRSHFRRAFGQPMVSFKSPEHGLRPNRAGKVCSLHRAFERERQSPTGKSCVPPFIGIFTISRFRSICSLWKTWGSCKLQTDYENCQLQKVLHATSALNRHPVQCHTSAQTYTATPGRVSWKNSK